MIYISAGHNAKAAFKPDPGAVGPNGIKEGDLTIEFRNLVTIELTKLGAKFTVDTNDETLKQYLDRIKTGNASVVLEFHFDAAGSISATGTSALIGTDADRLDKAFAGELAQATAKILGIRNRGVLSEADSHRGRLGLMREQGIVSLLEICFISNPEDLKKYQAGKYDLAKEIAGIVKKYEDMIQ